MSYSPFTWVDGLTPMIAARLNAIEQGVAKSAQVIRPEDYDSQAGNVGHDCTTAMQTAITASETTGGVLTLNAGRTYEVSASLVLNSASNFPARIVGHPTTWISARTGFSGTYVLLQNAGAGMVEDIQLIDVNIDGALLATGCVSIHYAHRMYVEGGWWKNATSIVGNFGGTHVYECIMRRTRLSGIQPSPSQTPAQMPAKGLNWDANDSGLYDIVVNNAQECVTVSRGGNYFSGLHVFGYPYKTASETRDFLATTGVNVSGQSNTLVGTYLDTQQVGMLVSGAGSNISQTRWYGGADWTPSLAAPIRVVDVRNDTTATGSITGVTVSGIPAGVTTGGNICYLRGPIRPSLNVSGIVPDQSGAGGIWSSGGAGSLVSHIASRGDGLVTNGSALLDSNYNFNGFSLVRSDHPTGAAGCFQSTVNTVLFSDEPIAVDPARFYDMAFALKQAAGDGARRFYSMLAPYDADGLAISPGTYMEQAGTRTTLASPLSIGATTVTLTSSANWANAAGASTQLRTIIFWAWTDGKGYTWPAGTYSRLLRSNAYADGGISGNVITLSSPWGGPVLPAGTPVSNGSSGASYMYGAQNILAPSSWTNYGAYRYGGVHTDLTVAASTAFPIATSSVRVGFLLNQGTTDPTAIARVANISLRPSVAKQTLAAAATDAATTQALANSLRSALINLGFGS